MVDESLRRAAARDNVLKASKVHEALAPTNWRLLTGWPENNFWDEYTYHIITLTSRDSDDVLSMVISEDTTIEQLYSNIVKHEIGIF